MPSMPLRYSQPLSFFFVEVAASMKVSQPADKKRVAASTPSNISLSFFLPPSAKAPPPRTSWACCLASSSFAAAAAATKAGAASEAILSSSSSLLGRPSLPGLSCWETFGASMVPTWQIVLGGPRRLRAPPRWRRARATAATVRATALPATAAEAAAAVLPTVCACAASDHVVAPTPGVPDVSFQHGPRESPQRCSDGTECTKPVAPPATAAETTNRSLMDEPRRPIAPLTATTLAAAAERVRRLPTAAEIARGGDGSVAATAAAIGFERATLNEPTAARARLKLKIHGAL
mmetsp:Transcript_97329/g.251636  ORF Transcript_97329/g.251636 Transcript_97329/m.251636 type:complete len:291 (-) Transcript_97329:38-910(-)